MITPASHWFWPLLGFTRPLQQGIRLVEEYDLWMCSPKRRLRDAVLETEVFMAPLWPWASLAFKD